MEPQLTQEVVTERYQPTQPVGLRGGLAVGVGRGIEGAAGLCVLCHPLPPPLVSLIGSGRPYTCLVQI